MVIGPARPGTVLPILAAAYGLTGREQEVIRGVFAGHSTKELSARLPRWQQSALARIAGTMKDPQRPALCA